MNLKSYSKKISYSLFAIIFLIAFTACNNSNESSNDTEKSTNSESVENKDSETKNEKENSELTKDEEENSELTKDEEESSKNLDDNEEEKASDNSTEDTNKNIIISADEAKNLIDENKDKNLVIAEVTWGKADASKDYLKKHIPSAIHINTDSIEEGPLWNFKSDDDLVKSMLEYGIDKDTTVLLYGPDSGAPRVALAYLMEGVENIKLIDGGISAWKDAGFDTEDGENKAEAKTDFKGDYPAHPELIVSLDQATKDIEDENNEKQYITTRSYEEYIGETSGYTYIPKAGELPSAIYGHDEADYKNADGTYISYEDMIKMLEDEGVDINKDMIFYCGTGWRAALPILKFYEKGIDTKLFDGGWNEWQMHDELPVQVGDPKTDVTMTTVGELSNDKASKE